MQTFSNIRIPVSGTDDHIAMSIHLPDPQVPLLSPPVVFIAGPGGSYSKEYYDLQIPGRPGYSQAQYHTTRGSIFIAYDHLGVGQSTVRDLDSITNDDIADANAAAISEALCRLEAGTLANGIPAISAPFKVGVGQSVGGGLTIMAQARWRCFDAIAILGYGINPAIPRPPHLPANAPLVFDVFRYAWFWDDTPPDIIELDMGGGYPDRATPRPWGTKTVTRATFEFINPGYIAADAAKIDVPVFIGAGERDILAAPLREAAAYATQDITVLTIPRMAHMHNFASTRAVLWRRLGDWAWAVATTHSELMCT